MCLGPELYALWSAVTAPIGWAAEGIGAVGSATGISAAEAAALGTGAAAVGLQMKAQGMQAEAQNRALQFQAKQAERNAAIAEREELALTKRHAFEQQQHRLRVRQALGEYRAGVGGSGVQVGVGSPLTVSQGIVEHGYQDYLALRQQQNFERFNVQQRAYEATTRGQFYRAQQYDPFLSQAGTFLTGASRLSSQYRRYKGY